MAILFEVVIPLRNPTEVFNKTIDSLVAQTQRDFSVLISDNFSTQGKEFLDRALTSLREADIPIQVVTPPRELDRVSHWNWAHFAASGHWLKPLFVGDYLEPDYFAEVLPVAQSGHDGLIFCCFTTHREGSTHLFECGGLDGKVPPEIALQKAILEGNVFGGPLNVSYPKSFFQSIGGHSIILPFIADFELYAKMSATRESYAIARSLANFVVHPARFSTRGSKMQRSSPHAEWLLVSFHLIYLALCRRVPLPWGRLLLRLIRMGLEAGKSFMAHYSNRSKMEHG